MPIRARIYQQPKTAMQSGHGRHARTGSSTSSPTEPQRADPLMGWIGSGDTQPRCRCASTRARRRSPTPRSNGIAYDLELPHAAQVSSPRPMPTISGSAATENWTH